MAALSRSALARQKRTGEMENNNGRKQGAC
jgi:hypothetical protein